MSTGGVMIRPTAFKNGRHGLNPSRIISKPLEMIVMDSLLGSQGYGDSIPTDASISGYMLLLVNNQGNALV